MAGTPLENFTDFVASTGPSYLTSAQKFLNEAVKTTYSLPRFLKGKGMDTVLQSGDKIKQTIMFDDASTFTHYHPNEEFNWVQPQVVSDLALDWRFSIDHMSWTDHEIELNVDSSRFTKRAQAQQYLSMKKKVEQRMWTSMLNGLEETIWADGSGETANMEASDGKIPYSIPAFIVEDTTNYHANGWTEIETIDPATQEKWRNQVSTYDYDDPDDTDGDGDGLIDAFDDMLTDVQFMPPDFHKEHFEDANLQTYRQAIFCSKGGLNQYKRLLRAANDTLVRKQDASYNRPQFDGIDLVRVAQLDSGTYDWDHDGTGSFTETSGSLDTDGYRYFWINGNYLSPVFHTTRYFRKMNPFHLEKQPYTYVCPVDCWWQLALQSRQRHGIVAPA